MSIAMIIFRYASIILMISMLITSGGCHVTDDNIGYQAIIIGVSADSAVVGDTVAVGIMEVSAVTIPFSLDGIQIMVLTGTSSNILRTTGLWQRGQGELGVFRGGAAVDSLKTRATAIVQGVVTTGGTGRGTVAVKFSPDRRIESNHAIIIE